MTSYLDPFGGTIAAPSDISYSEIVIDNTNQVVNLEWPLLYTGANNIFTSILIVNCSYVTGMLYLPDQTQGSVGQQVIIKNTGSQPFVVYPAIGTQIIEVLPGEVFFLWLADTNDDSDEPHWGFVQLGATTTQAQASALAGEGLIALADKLARNKLISIKDEDYLIDSLDRDTFFIWQGGNGTFILPDCTTPPPSPIGNGFQISINNNSSLGGLLTLEPYTDQTIDGNPTFQLQPGQSLTLVSNGENWNTLGFGQQQQINVSVLNVDVSTGTEFILNAAQAERIIQQYTGALSGDTTIYFPTTTPQYWYVFNNTSGTDELILNLGTPDDPVGSPLTIRQGVKSIFYSDTTSLNLIPSESDAVYPILAPDGTEEAPSYSFANSPGNGIWGTPGAPGTINYSVGGSLRHQMTGNGFRAPAYEFIEATGSGGDLELTGAQITVQGGLGTPTKPSMVFSVENSAANLGFFKINALNQLLVGKINAAASNPNYTWNDDLTTGIYSDTAGAFKTTCAGTQTLTFNANGIVPATTPVKTATFNAFSPTTTAGDMIARNNLGNDIRIPASTRANEPLLSVLGNIPQWTGYSILDIQTFTLTTNSVYTAAAATATPLTVNLTPKAVNSKVLVYFSCVGLVSASGVNIGINFSYDYIAGTFWNQIQNISGMFLFSPASTSLQTYTVWTSQAIIGAPTVYFNSLNGGVNGADSPYRSTIIAIEIGGF